MINSGPKHIAVRHMAVRHMAMRALGDACIFLALAAFSSAAWALAGYVHEISGTISIQSASVKPAPAKVGDTFESDSAFRTGADGKVVLKFADGQVAALGADSVLRVGEYRYVAGNLRQSTTNIELVQGQMRFVTGLIGEANREGVHVTAGNTMLRIQNPGGADFTVLVNSDNEEAGAAAVALGVVSVNTPYGRISGISAGQYAPWQPGRPLRSPMPIAAAPAVIQAAAAGLWTTVVPVNTPVAVAATARMAAMAAAASPLAQVAASADPLRAGFVDSISGPVSIQSGSGRNVGAKAGDTFPAGTAVRTGPNGRVVLKFADGQLVVLGSCSTLGIERYRFDPSDLKAGRSALDLVGGAMRYVSGSIFEENPESVTISAGASLIDFTKRGLVDFTVEVSTEGQGIGLTRGCDPGDAGSVASAKNREIGMVAVAAGEISVHTPYGPISKVDVGQTAPWQPGRDQQPPTPLAVAPAPFQETVASLSTKGLPENTPVVVAKAAVAAEAVAVAASAQAAAIANPGSPQLQEVARKATEQAYTATQAAVTASQAVAATVFAGALAALPATAAGPPLAQVPPPAPPLPQPIPAVTPVVTPGGGSANGCTGPTPC